MLSTGKAPCCHQGEHLEDVVSFVCNGSSVPTRLVRSSFDVGSEPTSWVSGRVPSVSVGKRLVSVDFLDSIDAEFR